jgi:hypothetical protein
MRPRAGVLLPFVASFRVGGSLLRPRALAARDVRGGAALADVRGNHRIHVAGDLDAALLATNALDDQLPELHVPREFPSARRNETGSVNHR